MSRNILCLFTQYYPYGWYEIFIEKEIRYLSEWFEYIYIYHQTKDNVIRKTPNNVELIYIPPPTSADAKKSLKDNYYLFCKIVLLELGLSRQRFLFFSKMSHNLHYLANCMYYANRIEQSLGKNILCEALFYSPWFYNWNLSLGILKSQKKIKKSIVRAHGFDLYENNGKPNYLPFRKFCLENTDKVFVISKIGSEYLKAIYPRYASRIVFSHLGTQDYGFGPFPHHERIHVVSCSSVVVVKRIHLIIEILKHIKSPVLWTHIGEGDLLEEIKDKAKKLPCNVLMDFKGSLQQDALFAFYQNTPVDVFVNVSISEGVPISIMEAISFGIPVIATNVGGTSEILNQFTGLLVEKYFDPSKPAIWIEQLKLRKDIVSYRKAIRQFWELFFFADRNYRQFLEDITI